MTDIVVFSGERSSLQPVALPSTAAPRFTRLAILTLALVAPALLGPLCPAVARAQDAQGAEALTAPRPSAAPTSVLAQAPPAAATSPAPHAATSVAARTSARPAPFPDALDAPSDAPSPVRLEVLVGATAPIDVDLSARVVLFDRLFVGGSLGFGVYGGLFAAAVQPFDSGAAQLASPIADSVFVASVSAGFRPFAGYGLELVGGYTLLHATPSLDAATVSAALGTQLTLPAGISTLQLDATLQALHVELGWTIVVADHFLIRPALGWTQTLAASATVSTTPTIAIPQVAAALDATSQLITSALTSYAMTPTVSLAVGYRF